MKLIYTIFSVLLLFAFVTCSIKENLEVKNIKDLDENMMDIRVYHELLGDELRAGDLQNAQWFLSGMDSILLIVADKYDTHRKLDKPFRVSYDRNIKPAIRELEKSINNNDLSASRNAYTFLTKKCNGCHLDNNIEKKIQNWLFRGQEGR
jgi:hypothetical protein